MPKTGKKLVWLILAAVIARVVFSLLFKPLVTPDSASYLEMAHQISSNDFSRYAGIRTPVYPVVLLLFQCNIQVVVVFQMILGVVISLMVFQIFMKIQDRQWLGFAAGLSYAVNPSQVLFERAVLTETTATVLVTASFLLYLTAVEKRRDIPACIFLGILSSLAALTKPLFQFLPLLFSILPAVGFFRTNRTIPGAVSRFVAVIIPAVLLLGSWSWFNHSKTGYFGISTMTGMGLMNHTGAFIENAPPEYETLKRVFIKYRQKRIKETGNPSGTVHLARKELMEKTGKNYVELNETLCRLSFSLIKNNPGAYLNSVAKAFTRFWQPTWYTDQGGIRKIIKSGNILMILAAGSFALVHFFCMLLFWVFPLAYAALPGMRKHFTFNFQVVSIYLVVFSTACFQSLLEYSENARYKIPVEPLIVALAVIFAIDFYRFLTRSTEKPSE